MERKWNFPKVFQALICVYIYIYTHSPLWEMLLDVERMPKLYSDIVSCFLLVFVFALF